MDRVRGARVLQIMRRRNLGRNQLAKLMGCSVGTVTNIRKGHDFSVELLVLLCRALEVSADEVLGTKPGEERLPAEVQRAIRAIEREFE